MAQIAGAAEQRANLGLRYLVYWIRKSPDHPFQCLQTEDVLLPGYLQRIYEGKQHTHINWELLAKILDQLSTTHHATEAWNWYPVQEVLNYLREHTREEQDLMLKLWRKYYEPQFICESHCINGSEPITDCGADSDNQLE